MKIRLYQWLERVFAHLEDVASTMRERVAICPHCGQNRYSGPPCIGR